MVSNPLNRYVLNTPMMPQFKKDADGGLTLYFQTRSSPTTHSFDDFGRGERNK
jgi:hypothetical protein